ncbi:hypothetical protein BHE90_010894 [Fusarium euwallaceae]|uniref:Uncharacterized protein n=3 Tax=Fusarium solani species complex TaxID=232080 RepID=A0A3M2S4P7_9HYPO|nr:hypothetical protein CDV36_007895 [Fusarium kuroshium]RSL80460.1 hypothetical protein CEP51_006551 [Fusarium floridanum]RTE74655.1 hypothetical protein BHE90_010894 [Fusarium euwallaceae]
MTEPNQNAYPVGVETTDGEYIKIDKAIFKPSSQDRLMSWQDGGSRINVGGSFRSTATAQEKIELPKGTYLAVDGTTFKLEYK